MDPTTTSALKDQDWSDLLASEPTIAAAEPRERIVTRPRDREIDDCIEAMQVDPSGQPEALVSQRVTARMPASTPSNLRALSRRTPERPTTRMEVTSLLAKAMRSVPPSRDHIITQRMSEAGSGVYEVVGDVEMRAERRSATQLLPTVGSDEMDALPPVAAPSATGARRDDQTQPFGSGSDTTSSRTAVGTSSREARLDDAHPYPRSVPARTHARNAVLLPIVAPLSSVGASSDAVAMGGAAPSRAAPPRPWLVTYGVLTTIALITTIALLTIR
ncbi:MAG: hypothetical protein J0L92_04000 [Deltaproteobacteria bacterium]|nr:hypothetical protein [Deltaproteobacteria bacterium]